MQLSDVQQKFVLHWGEMGARWGVNRTVAQVHALLYLWPQPLNAEQITETLGVARSNVSMSLRELQSWGIVRVVHVMGDRRDYFDSVDDVWELFRKIVDERKKREVDPTLKLLRECVNEAEGGARADAHTVERLQSMLEFFESVTRAYEAVRDLPSGALAEAIAELHAASGEGDG